MDTAPATRTHYEKIGDTEWQIQETQLDVFNDVTLWSENPRLLSALPPGVFSSEETLQAALRATPGYDGLKRSIEEIGQMNPIYVWRSGNDGKYLVLEGATRVAILRDLSLKNANGPQAGKFSRVKVKILPPHFGFLERAILLARIHVRGTGVRAWGRHIQSKFVYDNVKGINGAQPLMSVSEMALYLEKSISWVVRLRDAYEFALQFVNYIDDDKANQLADDKFSVLEEISKATTIGPQLRDYDNKKYDDLRADVFDMVRNDVFKEYRDARFLKQFYDDPDKWALLKTGEKHIASRLAAELKHGSTSLKAKISNLEQQVTRALSQDDPDLDDQDVDHLRNAMLMISEHVHPGVSSFSLELKNATSCLRKTTLHDVKNISPDDLKQFKEALEYFEMLVSKYAPS